MFSQPGISLTCKRNNFCHLCAQEWDFCAAPLSSCMASTLLMGPQIEEQEEGIKVRALFILEKGNCSPCHFTSAVWVQIKAVMRVYLHRLRCWPGEFCSHGDHLPGKQQESRELGEHWQKHG